MARWRSGRSSGPPTKNSSRFSELLAYGGQGKVLDARRRQLDRQREAVQPATDLEHPQGTLPIKFEIRHHRLCALPKKGGGRPSHDVSSRVVAKLGRQLQGRHRKLVLTSQSQSTAAGHQEGGLRRAEQQCVHQRARPASGARRYPARSGSAFPPGAWSTVAPDRALSRRRRSLWLSRARRAKHPSPRLTKQKAAFRKGTLDLTCGFQRQACLADAARPRQCEQPDSAGQEGRLDAFQLP